MSVPTTEELQRWTRYVLLELMRAHHFVVRDDEEEISKLVKHARFLAKIILEKT